MNQKQHYISKVITKPWEDSNRMLWYLDLEDNLIKQSSSEDLFSEYNLWEEEFEVIYQKSERRIPFDVERLINLNSKLAIDESTIIIRNLILLHFFNAKRSMNFHWNSKDIVQFSKSKAENRLIEIELFAAENNFIRLPLNNSHRYYFPQTGFFRIPIFNNFRNEMDIGIAIPIHPQCAIGIIPKGYNRIHFNEMLKSSEHITRDLSTGSKIDKKIIIHPDYAKNGNNEIVIKNILNSREICDEYFRKIILSSPTLFFKSIRK